MNRRALVLFLAGFLLFGAGCVRQNQQRSVEPPVVNARFDEVVDDVDAVEENAETISYGSSMDPDHVEESRADCTERGGRFNECGSACAPGQICAAVCVLKCEFPAE